MIKAFSQSSLKTVISPKPASVPAVITAISDCMITAMISPSTIRSFIGASPGMIRDNSLSNSPMSKNAKGNRTNTAFRKEIPQLGRKISEKPVLAQVMIPVSVPATLPMTAATIAIFCGIERWVGWEVGIAALSSWGVRADVFYGAAIRSGSQVP